MRTKAPALGVQFAGRDFARLSRPGPRPVRRIRDEFEYRRVCAENANARLGLPTQVLPAADRVADAQRLDDRLIAALVGLLQVPKQRAALRDQHQQAAARVVVLLVGLEVLGEVRDALGEDRHLHFGGPGVRFAAGVGPDQLSLAFGRDRHRKVSAQRWKTRTGLSRPARISQSATTLPPSNAATVREPSLRLAFNASACRGRRTTDRPCVSLKASSVVKARAGMSSSAVSTGSSTSGRAPLWHKSSSISRDIARFSVSGPTRVRRSALTCPQAPSASARSRTTART